MTLPPISTGMKMNDHFPTLKNGDGLIGAVGYCALCSVSFGGSMTMRPAKYLDGKVYHPACYPQAVEIYLADKKLRDAEASSV